MKVLLLTLLVTLMASCFPRGKTTVPVPYELYKRNEIPNEIPRSAGLTYSRGSDLEPLVALTFDDGPHPNNTPRLLDMLREHEVPATFFVVGNLVDRYPEIALRTVKEGHEIGNHSYTHGNLSRLSASALRRELIMGKEAIEKATGTSPKLFRPPYGALNTQQRQLARYEFGYPTVMWSVDPEDWKKPGPDVVSDRLVRGATNGGILLIHDLHSSSVDAVPAVITRLKKQGYKFVTVSQLINRSEALKNTSKPVIEKKEP